MSHNSLHRLSEVSSCIAVGLLYKTLVHSKKSQLLENQATSFSNNVAEIVKKIVIYKQLFPSRHDTYKQQFRAMFVMNCKVISDETLRYEAKQQKKKSSKKNKELPDNVSLEQSELYNPVQCTSCNTEVAVFDKDEVYHFFNVVESLP